MSTFKYRAYFAKNSDPFDLLTNTRTFDARTIVVPVEWPDHAASILARLYARQAVPLATKERPGFRDLPAALRPHEPIVTELGPETHYQQIIHRIAGGLAFGAIEHKIMDAASAEALYRDLCWLMARGYLALNSPAWFNGGMHFAYGLKGSDAGLWAMNPNTGRIERSLSAFEHPQLAACFILSLEDSLTGILRYVDTEARIFRSGSGTGTNLGKLRERNAALTPGGTSSGPLSFAKIGDANAGAIKSGGTTRRAAKMYVMDDTHPDIADFIQLKAHEEQKVAALVAGSAILADEADRHPVTAGLRADLDVISEFGIDIGLGKLDTNFLGEAYGTVTGQNANNSVRWHDDFFARLDADSTIELRSVVDNHIVRTVSAKQLWDLAAACTWISGDPGYQFPDTMAAWHTVPYYGPINATNPCGEYCSIDDSSCNLGTLNITRFLHGTTMDDFDLASFQHAAHTLAIALDVTVSISGYPTEEIARNTNRLRNLGANLTNLGGLLMLLGMPYDREDSRALAAALHSMLTAEVYRTSAVMASHLGASTAFIDNEEPAKRVLRQHAAATGSAWSDIPTLKLHTVTLPPRTTVLQNHLLPRKLAEALRDLWETTLTLIDEWGTRNMQATVAAPTGSISFVLNAQTFGIEPEFALAKTKFLADGSTMTIPCELIAPAMRNLGYDEAAIEAATAYAADRGTLLGAPTLNAEHVPIFRTATGPDAISPAGHIDMIAALQPHISGGVSKTVNAPNDSTIEDIQTYARRAYDRGVKGTTFFRDGSKLDQPLKRKTSTTKTCPNCKTENVVPTGACAICTACQTQIGGC
jgi:ribonucleoside-diphosphate reductase alpha chain